MSDFLRSLSCKGSSSISIRDQKGSGHEKPNRATFSLEKMTNEEEEMPLADYFQKKGLAFKLKRFIAKLGRNKKGKSLAGTQVVKTQNSEKPARAAFSDQVEVEFQAQVAHGDGAEEEIAPVGSASPMSTSPATPSALATPSPGKSVKSPGSGRGRRPKYDSQGNRRPTRSEVGKKYFSC